MSKRMKKRYIPYPKGCTDVPPTNNRGPRLDPVTFGEEGMGFQGEDTILGRMNPKVGINPAFYETNQDVVTAISDPSDDINLY